MRTRPGSGRRRTAAVGARRVIDIVERRPTDVESRCVTRGSRHERKRDQAVPVSSWSDHAEPETEDALDYSCPGCSQRCGTSLPDRVGAPCHLCAAAATWDRLPAGTRKAIDDAIRRGAIAGLLAMRAADPPIRLPDAADLLAFRHNAGVTSDISSQ